MESIKDFGFKIARMVFEERRTTDQIIDILSTQLIENNNGELELVELDKDWLRDQIVAVKSHPNEWGYTYRTPRKEKQYAPINYRKEE